MKPGSGRILNSSSRTAVAADGLLQHRELVWPPRRCGVGKNTEGDAAQDGRSRAAGGGGTKLKEKEPKLACARPGLSESDTWAMDVPDLLKSLVVGP
jgi:hypothetical protein